jgi:hypothetical protein
MKSIGRRFLILFITSFIFIPAHSQVLISILLGDKLNSDKLEFGVDGGLNLSNQSGLSQSNMLSSFNLGFYFDFKLKQSPWMVHTGVIVKSNVGAADLPVYSLNNTDLDNAFTGGSIERKLSYFHVPVLMKYSFTNHFFLEAGPQLGLLYKAYDEFANTVQGDDLTYRNEIRDGFHCLDAGITTGIGYRLMGGNGMNLGVRYYYGLVDVVIDDTGSSVENRSLYFTVGIPIGAGKAKEKTAEKEKK